MYVYICIYIFNKNYSDPINYSHMNWIISLFISNTKIKLLIRKTKICLIFRSETKV